MRKKITSKSLEKMLLDYTARKRIADMDFGTYFPVRSRSANATNPFAQAKADPGLPVAFEILTDPPLSGSVVWKSTGKLPIQPTCLNIQDFWLEPESPLTPLAAAGAPDEENRSPRERDFDAGEDFDPKQLDGEFRFTLDSAEYSVFDIETTPPEGTPPSIDVVQPNGKIDIDGKRGERNLSNPDSRLEARVVKKSTGGARHKDARRSPSRGIQDANQIMGPHTSEQIRYTDVINKCYDLYWKRWFRDKEMGEDACQEGFISFFRYCLTYSPNEYSDVFRRALAEAIRDENFDLLSNLMKKRIKSRKISLIEKQFGSGDKRRYETSIDRPLVGDQEGVSLAHTLVGREITPDQELIIKERIQRQGNVKDARLASAMKKLPPRQRQALILRFEQNTYKECAYKMGATVGALKNLLNRAIARLVKELIIKEDIQRQGNVKTARLARAMKKLPPRQRQALILNLEPNTYEDCANKMGTTVDAFTSLLNRAIARLEKELIIKEDIQRQGNVKTARLALAMKKLSNRQRQALILHFEPNTYEECAKKLGKTVDAFTSLLNRAIARLEEILNEGTK
jgi:RNA polymerase sigma factor (sigma-70 family)